MADKDKKTILLVAGNSKALKDMQRAFHEKDVTVYSARSTFYAVKTLFDKQVDAVFVFSGFSHTIAAIRMFSTIPCTYVYCNRCINPGAADFIVKESEYKPGDLPEYFERMLKINELRTKFSGVVWFSKLRIDIDNYIVEYKGVSFKLKPLEIKLLFYLCKNLNRVVARSRLLFNVWGYEQIGATRTLDVHIMSLRAFLHSNSIPLEILTLRGEGYKLFDTETIGGFKYFM